jgi:hypothetical protein
MAVIYDQWGRGQSVMGSALTGQIWGGGIPAQSYSGSMTPSIYRGGSGGGGGGQIRGASTGGEGGGGGGGGGQPQPSAPPMHSAPAMPSINWDAVFAPAFSALSKYEATLQPQYETQVKELETKGEQQTAETKAEEKRRMDVYGQERTRETRRGESAVAEARRIASEGLKTLSAQFGTTTQAGGAFGERLISQTSRNIAQNRAVLQETLGAISQTEENLRNETSRIINDINENVSLAKEKARNWLNSALADVSMRRGELESRKAERRIEAVMQYQSMVADVEARNTEFRQQLYRDATLAQQEIDTMKERATLSFKAPLEPTPDWEAPEFEVGDTRYKQVPKGYQYLRDMEGEEEREVETPWD